MAAVALVSFVVLIWNGAVLHALREVIKVLFEVLGLLGASGRFLSWFLSLALLVPMTLFLCWSIYLPYQINRIAAHFSIDSQFGLFLGFGLLFVLVLAPFVRFHQSFVESAAQADDLTLTGPQRLLPHLTGLLALAGHALYWRYL